MGCDDSGTAGRQVGHGDVCNQRHAPALPEFTLDSFPEQLVSGPSPPLFEFRDGFVFLRIPVVTDRKTKDAGTLDRIAAQNGCPMQTVITLAVYLQILLQPLIL